MKPCDKCPWVSKDPRDKKALTPEVRKAARDGGFFCCHVRMGTCHGAASLQGCKRGNGFINQMKHIITINEDGTMTSLGNPLGLPVKKSERWSHIKPVNLLLLLLFNTVRYCFGDNGRAAAWTRRWRCTWQLNIPSLNYSARCGDRQALIDIEHEKYFVSEGIDL